MASPGDAQYHPCPEAYPDETVPPLANKELAAALTFAGYEHRFVFGDGGHTLHHGGALFADALRWLFS